ncbi:MAG: TonB-dependent receptor [Bacteroidales bacterium]|nr:TonB-dependent receptor [Bacteroidales bacterium]
MKRFISLFIFTLACISLHAQIITIKDKENYQPLDLVTLSSQEPAASAITNIKGQADISAFTGSSLIEIRLLGYEPVKISWADLARAGFHLNLSQSAISLDQVIISATRWSQMTREVPSKITLISAKEVALQNPQTAADLLGASGEIFIQKSQLGGGSPMIRGFATNRVLLVVDGIRMNTAIFRSGNLQNVIALDPFAVEKTEIFFGPGSVIYGSDAIGGVMNFQTLTPRLSVNGEPYISGNAVTRFSSANKEMTGHLDVNVGWKKWAMVTSFSQFHFSDLRMGSNGPDDYLRPNYVIRQDSADVVITNPDPLVQTPTGYDQTSLMQKVRFSPNANWDLTYGIHYSTTTNVSRYDRLLRTKNGLPRSAEWYYGPQTWMMNTLNIENKATGGIYDRMNIRLAHQLFEESRHDRDRNKATRFNRFEKVNAYSVNIDFTKIIREKHRLFYGLEYISNKVESTGTDEDITTGESIPGPARYPQSTWASYAAYLTYHYKINEKFNLQAGARYNHYTLDAEFDTTFYPFPFTAANLSDGAITGSVGLVYNPAEKWSFGADISTGFRSPNVDDIGKVFDSEPGAVMVPNPDLSAEYVYNAEIDIARVFGNFMKIDLVAYYTYLDHALVRRDFTLNGQDSIFYDGEMSRVQAMQNAAFATVYGVQAEVEVKLPSGFGFSTQFNYQKGEEELDDGTKSPLRHAAPWFGKSGLTFSADKLKIDLYAAYSGEVSYESLPPEEQGKDYMYAKDEDGNPYSPSWYTLNFKAMYQISDILSVSGGVENITDVRYRPYSSGITAPGRNLVLSLRASF